MEVDINNAFLLAVKLPLSYGLSLLHYNLLSKKLEEDFKTFLLFLLEKPLITTIFLSFFVGGITMILSISFSLFLLVFLLVAYIILFEGIIVILVFAIAIQMMLMAFSTNIVINCMKKLLNEIFR